MPLRFGILLSILIILTSPISAQVNIANSRTKAFYIYQDSIFKTGPLVLFTGQVQEKGVKSIAVFLGNCLERTFLETTTQRTVGKSVEWMTPRNPKKYITHKNSAMDIALTLLCEGK